MGIFRAGLPRVALVAVLVSCLEPACNYPRTNASVRLSTSQVSFTGAEAGADPADQSVVMTGIRRPPFDPLPWTASVDVPWLSVSPASGMIHLGESLPLTLHVNMTYSAEGWVRATSTVGAPSARRVHSQVWAGDQMVVWGGSQTPLVQFNDGGRYDPGTDTWLGPTALAGTPTARHLHTGVWTGSEMIVWGGWSQGTSYVNTGGTYVPDAWLGSTSTTGALSAREAHSAVWTGSRMIVWGGYYTTVMNTGALYDPGADAWTGTTATLNAPVARQEHAAVWTGSEMIVWGGRAVGAAPLGGSLNTGGFYDPSTDTWTGATSTLGAPSPRMGCSAVWAGSEMIVWGGFDQDSGNAYYADGMRYDPVVGTWKALPAAGAPSARRRHRAVWTGTQMVVWGGEDAVGPLNTGAIYQPPVPRMGAYLVHVTIAPTPGDPVTLTVLVNVTP